MDLVIPLDIPNLIPDNWDVFWSLWEENSTNLVKTKFIPQNPITRPAPNGSYLGRNNIWIGMDLYQRVDAEYKTSWKSPYIDIKSHLPNLYQQCLDLPFKNISCVRIVKSLINFTPHSDAGLDTWSIRGMFYHPWEEQQWYFTPPDIPDNKIPLKLPKETMWFAYHDKHIWHGTHLIHDKPKLLIIVEGTIPKDLMEKSKLKYQDYVVTEKDF